MEVEHTKKNDSRDEFTTGNYGVSTTPEIEWWFVVEGSGKGLQRLGRAACTGQGISLIMRKVLIVKS